MTKDETNQVIWNRKVKSWVSGGILAQIEAKFNAYSTFSSKAANLCNIDVWKDSKDNVSGDVLSGEGDDQEEEGNGGDFSTREGDNGGDDISFWAKEGISLSRLSFVGMDGPHIFCARSSSDAIHFSTAAMTSGNSKKVVNFTRIYMFSRHTIWFDLFIEKFPDLHHAFDCLRGVLMWACKNAWLVCFWPP